MQRPPLRLLTRLWGIDPAHAVSVAPGIGSDVPACLLSLTARGEGAGDALQLVQDPTIAGTPVLLVNPAVPLSTGAVFAAWDGIDRGPLTDWREGRNDLEAPALSIAPVIGEVLDWLKGQDGANFVRMSGSGATCFALFDGEAAARCGRGGMPLELVAFGDFSAIGAAKWPARSSPPNKCAQPKRGRSTAVRPKRC